MNRLNASIEMILFFADHGFYLRTGIKPSGTYNGKQKAKLLVAN